MDLDPSAPEEMGTSNSKSLTAWQQLITVI